MEKLIKFKPMQIKFKVDDYIIFKVGPAYDPIYVTEVVGIIEVVHDNDYRVRCLSEIGGIWDIVKIERYATSTEINSCMNRK